jgi:predicted acyltransferase
LRRAEAAAMSKVAWLFGGGVVLVGVGFLWGLQFPVVKKIWTSSFVLVAGGWSAMLLGAFYLVVDVWQWQRWAQPFVWIGMNPITLYLASNLLGGFRKVAARLAGGDVKVFFDTALGTGFGDFVLALVGLTLMLLFARFLYQRKIFLRL